MGLYSVPYQEACPFLDTLLERFAWAGFRSMRVAGPIIRYDTIEEAQSPTGSLILGRDDVDHLSRND